MGLVLALLIGATAPIVGMPAPAAAGSLVELVELRGIASGLAAPVDLTAPAGDDRLFIVERAGRIRILDGGRLRAEPYLDITGPVRSTGGEQGLLGLAFDPDYESNGFFYVNYTADAGGGDTVIARYRVSSGDPNRADPASARILLTVDQPAANHNGGQLAFGPDGFLYVALGDGGGGGDPGNNGQNKGSLLGSILRINPADGSAPSGNPFVDAAGADRIWAYGLRNPWRFSFDAVTGDMFIGDVGQSAREEVDVAPRGVGGINFGWDIEEGTSCHQNKPPGCGSGELTRPVLQYSHSQGCSITGGRVYRGSAIPQLRGHYFYADFCTDFIRSFRLVEGKAVDSTDWTSALRPPNAPSSFGTDGFGELYIVSLSGTIHKFVPTLADRCDFDGDGHGDVPVGAPNEGRDGVKQVGEAQTFAGGGTGVKVAVDRRYHEGTGGLLGAPRRGDRFGFSLACGDFNGDGYGDLAVGTPFDLRRQITDAGNVHVIYGSRAGLTTDGDQLWRQDSAGMRDDAEAGDLFGYSLAAGDLNRDGHDELVIGVPGEDLAGFADAGAAAVLYGSPAGLIATGNELLHEGLSGIAGSLQAGAMFGTAVAVGDFGGDGYGDVVAGVPGRDVGGIEDAGGFHVFKSDGARIGHRDQSIDRGKPAIVGTAEPGAAFGSSLTSGNFDGDQFDDLAIGAPGAADGGGDVSVLFGREGRLGSRDVLLKLGRGSLLGAAQDAGDRFGSSLAAGDFDGDGRSDLVIGSPGEIRRGMAGGMVTLVSGSGSGLSSDRARHFHQAQPGLLGAAEDGADFGAALRATDVTGDGRADLLIGVPGSSAGSGEVAFLRGAVGGLTTAGDQLWGQGFPGVSGKVEAGDRFGQSV